jgi:glutathione S-transferase
LILIGQYDSPFVRRVGIALRLYGMEFEHRPYSSFGDADKIAEFNPLRRVPTLVLDNGEVLVDSVTALDHLDELAGPSKALIPDHGSPRRHALKVVALATGATDKAVSLFYEGLLHTTVSATWTERCRTQIGTVLDVLEGERAVRGSTWWFGDRIGHADIAVACLHRFMREVHPEVLTGTSRPVLAAHAHLCESLEPFKEISQPFIPPKG